MVKYRISFYQYLVKALLLSGCLSVASLGHAQEQPASTDLSSKIGTSESSAVQSQQTQPLNNDADVPEGPDASGYVEELERMKSIQRQTLEITQELALEKLRAELLLSRGGAQREGASPYVLALTGMSKMRKARLMVPGYGEMTVRRGDTLPGGWRIVAVTNQAVFAQHSDSPKVQLPFYAF